MTALNKVEVLVADIFVNVYLNADCCEKVYTIVGPEYGSRARKNIVITQALYGLICSDTLWRANVASTMIELNFTPCQADPDTWIQPAVNPDGMKYYEYVLIYVDDNLVISHRARTIIDSLFAFYCLNEIQVMGRGMLHQIDIWGQTLICTQYWVILVANINGTLVLMIMCLMPLRM